MKNAHMRQIEQMESEELMTQKKLRTEVIQLEDMLAQVRKEYEMLRIEFEQNLAANEQTGPINKEMRNLIQSLQTHNVQVWPIRFHEKLFKNQLDEYFDGFWQFHGKNDFTIWVSGRFGSALEKWM